MLQQYLPFTVLKLSFIAYQKYCSLQLQQYLPFTVLKQSEYGSVIKRYKQVATVLTVYGIETATNEVRSNRYRVGCNSTYRLRY